MYPHWTLAKNEKTRGNNIEQDKNWQMMRIGMSFARRLYVSDCYPSRDAILTNHLLSLVVWNSSHADSMFSNSTDLWMNPIDRRKMLVRNVIEIVIWKSVIYFTQHYTKSYAFERLLSMITARSCRMRLSIARWQPLTEESQFLYWRVMERNGLRAANIIEINGPIQNHSPSLTVSYHRATVLLRRS